jgi:putative ABC transport system ATP-binding protein
MTTAISTAASMAGVRKTFRTQLATVEALRGIDLTIAQGSFTAIMGASGSGKSTLLNVLAGLTSPDAGSVSIAGQNIAHLDDRALTIFRRRHLGIIFQAFNLVPVLSARDNVALPLLLDGVGQKQAHERANAALQRVGLAPRATHRPDALSGGEQQRVAIARALVSNPAIILADEPTGNLDSTNADLVAGLLSEVQRSEQRTVVVITHEAQIAYRAEHVVVLADGCVRGTLQRAQFTSPAALAQAYLDLVAVKASV